MAHHQRWQPTDSSGSSRNGGRGGKVVAVVRSSHPNHRPAQTIPSYRGGGRQRQASQLTIPSYRGGEGAARVFRVRSAPAQRPLRGHSGKIQGHFRVSSERHPIIHQIIHLAFQA